MNKQQYSYLTVKKKENKYKVNVKLIKIGAMGSAENKICYLTKNPLLFTPYICMATIIGNIFFTNQTCQIRIG